MASEDTGKAIGMVTKFISIKLASKSKLNVSIGRPDSGLPTPPGNGLNLFLYEIIIDGSMRNVSLEQGRPAPLWLVLKYMLTAYGNDNASDSQDFSNNLMAHNNLGEGMRCLQELNFLSLSETDWDQFLHVDDATNFKNALGDNPEPLKITFDESARELQTQLMRGPDEQYRVSVSFQIRPVLLIPREPPSLALLVGVNYEKGGHSADGGLGLLPVNWPGPRLEAVSPAVFELGERVSLSGSNLDVADLRVNLDGKETNLKPTLLTANRLDFVLSDPTIAPGHHTIRMVQPLSTLHNRTSQPQPITVLPVLSEAKAVGNDLQLTGKGLWAEEDNLVALYLEGKVVAIFEGQAIESVAPGTGLKIAGALTGLSIVSDHRVILRVNGAQARLSPKVVVP